MTPPGVGDGGVRTLQRIEYRLWYGVMVNGKPGAEKRGGDALGRVFQYPSINQGDDDVGPKITGVRADDVVAVGIGAGGINAKSFDGMNTTGAPVPCKLGDIIPATKFGEGSQPGE